VSSTSLCFCTADVISVDINRPENNREVTVYQVDTLPGLKEGTYYQAYMVCLPADIRFILDEEINGTGTEWYKARVFDKERKIMIRMPAWDYCQLHDRQEFQKSVHQTVTDGMDDARHKFVESKTRKWKYLLLEFPVGHKLKSSVIYDYAGEKEELDCDMLEIDVQHKYLETISTVHYATWLVARTDVDPRKKGKVEIEVKKNKNTILLEKLRAKKKKGTSGVKSGGMDES